MFLLSTGLGLEGLVGAGSKYLLNKNKESNFVDGSYDAFRTDEVDKSPTGFHYIFDMLTMFSKQNNMRRLGDCCQQFSELWKDGKVGGGERAKRCRRGESDGTAMA